MKLAWYAKLYINVIISTGLLVLTYYIYFEQFILNLHFIMLLIALLLTAFFGNIQLKYTFKFTSAWYPIIYFHYGIVYLLISLFIEALVYESLYHKKLNYKAFFNIGQFLLAGWGAHHIYVFTKFYLPKVLFFNFLFFSTAFYIFNSALVIFIIILADIFNKKIILEITLIYLISFPLYSIVFSSYLTSPILTTILVPTVFFFVKKIIISKLITTFEDEQLETDSYIYSRQFFFNYLNKKKKLNYPLWLNLVENTSGINTSTKNMFEFAFFLRSICGQQLFCRYTSNRILIISHSPLHKHLRAAHLSFTTVKIENENFVLETLLSELELKLNQLTRQASKQREMALSNSVRLATIGQLAAGLAHEIRNPLTSVKGFLQLYSLGKSLDKESIQLMKSELNRINQLVTDLLYLSAPMAEPKSLERHDISQLAREVVELLKPDFLSAGVQLELHLSALPPVALDRNQIKQVLLNLVQNALQAVAPLQGQVVLETAQQGHQIMVRIRDNGPGIPPELQERIFDPFYTTKEHGTGLGLTICRQIVNAHGGQIQVASHTGQTLVEFTLPVH